MAPTIHYHCPCLSPSPLPPPPHLPSSSYSFHPLESLLFCEECDTIRCDRCVVVEIGGYYCPNCLFEVPSASVRAEKNRCARNCFMCPNCRNTLSVVSSDPYDISALMPPGNAGGDPPFFLYCNYCRWDSVDVGITFERSSGIVSTSSTAPPHESSAVSGTKATYQTPSQLQKAEDSTPESLEFDRLKEHFEPFVRASLGHAFYQPSSAVAAANAALNREVPVMGRYGSHSSSLGSSRRGNKDKDKGKKPQDEFPVYKARLDAVTATKMTKGGGEADVELLRRLESPYEIASLEQRWMSSWASSLKVGDLKPLRIPLRSKRNKRCPCSRILLRHGTKSQAMSYNVKWTAAHYLPAFSITLPHTHPKPAVASATARSTAAVDLESQGGMHAGKTYAFHLGLTNPLLDPIQVRLSVQRVHVATSTGDADGKDDKEKERARRPPFAVSLPTSVFPVSEYRALEEDEDLFDDDEEDYRLSGILGGKGSIRDRDGKNKVKTVGVLEKRGNVTIVGGEVVIGKEARGNVKFNMLVTYNYKGEDDYGGEDEGSVKKPQPTMKTSSFYTVVDLGPIIPRERKEEGSEA